MIFLIISKVLRSLSHNIIWHENECLQLIRYGTIPQAFISRLVLYNGDVDKEGKEKLCYVRVYAVHENHHVPLTVRRTSEFILVILKNATMDPNKWSRMVMSMQ